MDFSDVIEFCNKEHVEYIIEGNTADLTTIRVGGRASLIVFPHNMLVFCRMLDMIVSSAYKYVIIGNGSNCYFCKKYDGIVIVTKKLSDISVKSNKITAMCGASISSVARLALCHLLSGIEFAYGIPGTIGGAVYMNAEAFGGNFENITVKSLVYDTSHKVIKEISKEQHFFEKKKTIFSNKEYIILQTTLSLLSGTYEKIYNEMQANFLKRNQNQPLNFPSAGSAFKRPNSKESASYLIDKAGLKGLKIGGAEVSKKHAGFIINSENATPCDINNLLKKIKTKISTEFSVNLEEEIIYIE